MPGDRWGSISTSMSFSEILFFFEDLFMEELVLILHWWKLIYVKNIKDKNLLRFFFNFLLKCCKICNFFRDMMVAINEGG